MLFCFGNDYRTVVGLRNFIIVTYTMICGSGMRNEGCQMKKMRHRLSRFGLCPHSKISFHSCNSDQICVFRNNFAQILATETTHTHLIHCYCVCLLSVKVENVGMCALADACVSLHIPARSIVGTHLFPNGLVSLNMLVSYCSHSCDSV